MKRLLFLFALAVTATFFAAEQGVPAQPAPAASPPSRDPFPPVPDGVRAYRDVSYVTGGHERQTLDLYVPMDAKQPLPVIISVHGGAWLMGSKNGAGPLRDGFTTRGYAIASINYRLSQHAAFPAQIEDCKAALRWLRAHAAEYNLDPGRFGVSGSSAGGHLVALLGTTGDTREFDVGENLGFSSGVQAVVDYYGPTDFLQMDAHVPPGAGSPHDAPNSPESRLIGGAIQAAENRAKVQRANPISYVNRGDAPFLIVHGDADFTVPHHQSELLYAALVEREVPVHFITVKGGGHGNGFPGQVLQPIVVEFFERHLHGKLAAARWSPAVRSEVSAKSNK